MSKTNQIVLGIITLFIIIAGFGYWVFYYGMNVNSEEINQAVVKVKSVNANILSNENVTEINKKNIYGSIPVTISQGEVGRQDPFSSF